MLHEARDSFLSGMELQWKCHPKIFWSTLKLKSKHPSIPEATSMATDPSSEPTDVEVEFKHHHQLKSFNCSIGTSCRYLHLTLSLVIQLTRCTLGLMLTLSDLTLTVTRVLNVLVNLDTIKATSLDEILARILKETAYEIAPSSCLSDWASFPWTGNWPRWSLYSRKIIKNMLRTTGQFRYCARFLRW